jgi:exopolysaccharide biosynthesis protein
VIDGRQPLYSQVATLAELAEIMLYYGTDTAMNLDGGGSSTLVV